MKHAFCAIFIFQTRSSVEELVEALPVKNDVVINSVDFDNTSYTQIVQSIIKKQKERKEKMDF